VGAKGYCCTFIVSSSAHPGTVSLIRKYVDRLLPDLVTWARILALVSFPGSSNRNQVYYENPDFELIPNYPLLDSCIRRIRTCYRYWRPYRRSAVWMTAAKLVMPGAVTQTGMTAFFVYALEE
jgi:hypothetical protein